MGSHQRKNSRGDGYYLMDVIIWMLGQEADLWVDI